MESNGDKTSISQSLPRRVLTSKKSRPLVHVTPQVQEIAGGEEVPVVEDAPVVEDVPVVEEAPVAQDAPVVQEISPVVNNSSKY